MAKVLDVFLQLVDKFLDWNTDKFIGVGLVITLIVSIFFGYDATIQTNIISGLVGYMSKTMIVEGGKSNDKSNSSRSL